VIVRRARKIQAQFEIGVRAATSRFDSPRLHFESKPLRAFRAGACSFLRPSDEGLAVVPAMAAVLPTVAVMAVVAVAAVVPAAAVMAAAAVVVVVDAAAQGQDAHGKGCERGEAPTGARCGHGSFLSRPEAGAEPQHGRAATRRSGGMLGSGSLRWWGFPHLARPGLCSLSSTRQVPVCCTDLPLPTRPGPHSFWVSFSGQTAPQEHWRCVSRSEPQVGHTPFLMSSVATVLAVYCDCPR